MPAPLPNSPIKLNLPEMVDRAEKSGSRSKLCTMELWTFALFTIISSFYSVLALPPKGVCLLEGDEGPCRANIERYYYNTITQKCEVFYYGGCQGNANNFRSYQECHKTCYKIPKVPPICRVPKDEGPCRALLPSYFFNMTTMQCEPFSYGGCQGNSNRFQSLVSCMEYCSPKRFPPVLCREPLDKGKCSASITRYYYNAATKMCEEFVYSGCGGTNNNFVSLQGCMDVCGKGWKKHTGQGKFKRMRQYRKPMPSLQV